MVLGWDLPHRPVMPVRGGEQRSLVAAARAVEEARKVLRGRAVASWFLPGPSSVRMWTAPPPRSHLDRRHPSRRDRRRCLPWMAGDRSITFLYDIPNTCAVPRLTPA